MTQIMPSHVAFDEKKMKLGHKGTTTHDDYDKI